MSAIDQGQSQSFTQRFNAVPLRYAALGILVVVPLVFSLLWATQPAVRRSFIEEGYFLQSMTAFLFAASAVLGLLLIWVYRRAPLRLFVLMFLPLMSALFFLEEVDYFGMPIPPLFDTVSWEGVHHLLIQVPLEAWRWGILDAPRMAFFSTGLAVYIGGFLLLGVYYILIRHDDPLLKSLVVWVIPVILMVLVATIIDSPIVSKTYTLEFIEELLELEAALLLLVLIVAATWVDLEAEHNSLPALIGRSPD